MDLPSPAWSLSRAALDTVLLEHARAVGVLVHQPATVRDVRYHDDHAEIRQAHGPSHDADVVVHADGSGRHDPAGATPIDHRFVAAKCHFAAGDGFDPSVRIRSNPGLYLGTIPVEDGLGTCALVARTEMIRTHRGDVEALLNDRWPDRGWKPEGSWDFCGLPRSSLIQPGHPRSFRIGNAAAAVDPIGGEGIGLALWSGQELSRHLTPRTAQTTAQLAHAQHQFARAYRDRLRTRRPACRWAAECLIRPRIVRCAGPLLRLPAITIAPWYRLTGKADPAAPVAQA
jgi:flavin-dependent dehydrogenase